MQVIADVVDEFADVEASVDVGGGVGDARATLQRIPRLADVADVVAAHGPVRVGR